MEDEPLLTQKEKRELLKVFDFSCSSMAGLEVAQWPTDRRWTGTRLHEAIVARTNARPYMMVSDYSEVSKAINAKDPELAETYTSAGRKLLESLRSEENGQKPAYRHYGDYRFYSLLTLGRAAALTGDREFVEAGQKVLVRHWRRMPAPPRGNRRDRRFWSVMGTGQQMRHLMEFLYMAPLAGYIEDEVMAAMLLLTHKYLMVTAHYDFERYHFSNITFIGLIGAYCWSVLFPEYHDSEKLQKTWADWLRKNINNTIRSDGGQYEQSPNYQNCTQHFLAFCYRHDLVNRQRLGKAFVKRIGKAAEFFSRIRMPAGTVPPIGDTGVQNRDLSLALTALTADRRDVLHGLRRTPGLSWHLGSKWVQADFSDVQPPSQCTFGFKKSGYYVMRSGWEKDATYGLFLCGPHGMYHGHYDLLSLFVASGDTVLVGDVGSYRYDNSPARLGTMGTPHHSTLSLDGISYRPFEDGQPPLARVTQWEEMEGKVFCSSVSRAYDHLYGNPVLKRQFFFDGKGVWIMVDRMHSTHMHAFNQNFIIPFESVEATEDQEKEIGIFISSGSAPRLAVVQARINDFAHVQETFTPYNAERRKGKQEAIHYRFVQNVETGFFVTMLAVLGPGTVPEMDLHAADPKRGVISVSAKVGEKSYDLQFGGRVLESQPGQTL